MSFTLTTLKQAIQDYTENSETTFVNNLDTFIKIAEERILKTVQLDFFRKNVTGNVSASNKYLAKPTDFLAPFSLSLEISGSKEFLEFKDVSFLQTYTPDSSVTGTAKYYSVFNTDNFILAPTPNAAANAELHYFFRPTSLVDDASGSTWLSQNAELTLLYGCLIEAYIFMKGEQDVMAMYDKRYQESLSGLKLLGEAKETTQDYRVGRVIRQKQ